MRSICCEKKNHDFCNLTQATYIMISWVYPCSMYISVLNNIHGTQKLELFVLDNSQFNQVKVYAPPNLFSQHLQIHMMDKAKGGNQRKIRVYKSYYFITSIQRDISALKANDL